MNISELTAGQGKVEITGEILEVGQPRTFDKFGKQGRVANATLKDSTGQIKVSLWNEQVDQVKPGATIKISNGYVNEWQGEKQLSTGKFGTLEVIKEGNAPIAAPSANKPAKPVFAEPKEPSAFESDLESEPEDDFDVSEEEIQ